MGSQLPVCHVFPDVYDPVARAILTPESKGVCVLGKQPCMLPAFSMVSEARHGQHLFWNGLLIRIHPLGSLVHRECGSGHQPMSVEHIS